MSGIVDEAGGVLSARSNSRTKNATNTFMPANVEIHIHILVTANISNDSKITGTESLQYDFTYRLNSYTKTDIRRQYIIHYNSCSQCCHGNRHHYHHHHLHLYP